MEIDEHIKNLEKYCEDDDLFEKDGDFKEFCDNHIADIKAVLQEYKNTQSDLYEANKRIADLLLILGDRDRIIDEMANTMSAICTGIVAVREQFERQYCEFITSDEDCCWKTDKSCTDCIREYFEKRCNNAKD